jgi:hypothetical protein
MKTKKKHPAISRSLKTKPVQSRQKLWIAIILLLFIIIGYLVWARSLSDTSTVAKSDRWPAEQTETASDASVLVADNANHDNTNLDTIEVIDSSTINDDNIENIDDQKPIPIVDTQTILNAPLPKTNSLAKEEIDRLEDERQRLAEQEKSAAEQIVMNKQLTDMKSEQIKILEQQIAQLEATNELDTNAQ